MKNKLTAYVVIATKGRPNDIDVVTRILQKQTVKPAKTIVVGTCDEDLGVVGKRPGGNFLECILSERAGTTIQRNVGLERVLELHGDGDDFIIIYFDDDFRPKDNWIESALNCFSRGDIAALTGTVLADGIKSLGISEADALSYISGDLSRKKVHWTVKSPDQEVRSAYGCNMAFSGKVSRLLRFDETFLAYGWLEDRDYSRRATKFGLMWCSSDCQGVHLGTKSGRVSGVKFGYSQIANPFYLRTKGTMTIFEVLRLVGRNLLANHARMFFPEPWVDRMGRVRGNWIGIFDLIKGRAEPEKINEL